MRVCDTDLAGTNHRVERLEPQRTEALWPKRQGVGVGAVGVKIFQGWAGLSKTGDV